MGAGATGAAEAGVLPEVFGITVVVPALFVAIALPPPIDAAIFAGVGTAAGVVTVGALT